MKKLYVGMLLSVLFCTADAMEADASPQPTQPLERTSSGEQHEEMKEAFAKAEDGNGDAYQASLNILTRLRNWYVLIPDKKLIDPNAVDTIEANLSDAVSLLSRRDWNQNDVQRFRCWTMNATNVMYSLHRQQEKQARRQRKAREPEKSATREPRQRLYRTKKSVY
ncbi:MAG TPA: hypothetical protein ENI27_09000 [bacterium]|nr:hypothetical protein [bacterium]